METGFDGVLQQWSEVRVQAIALRTHQDSYRATHWYVQDIGTAARGTVIQKSCVIWVTTRPRQHFAFPATQVPTNYVGLDVTHRPNMHRTRGSQPMARRIVIRTTFDLTGYAEGNHYFPGEGREPIQVAHLAETDQGRGVDHPFLVRDPGHRQRRLPGAEFPGQLRRLDLKRRDMEPTQLRDKLGAAQTG